MPSLNAPSMKRKLSIPARQLSGSFSDTYRSFLAVLRFFAFGLPRFFGAGGVLSIARTASSKLPAMGGTVVSALRFFAIKSHFQAEKIAT